MNEPLPPFTLDLSDLKKDATRRFGNRVDGIQLTLPPFLTISVKPQSEEKRIAREVLIRLRDRRVLKSSHCCDGCIDDSLSSLQRIRDLLVDKQVDLSFATTGPLYFLLDYMLEAVRQFMTFKERLDIRDRRLILPNPSFYRDPDIREAYYEALPLLRLHLEACQQQIGLIADVELPQLAADLRYDEAWQRRLYVVQDAGEKRLPPVNEPCCLLQTAG